MPRESGVWLCCSPAKVRTLIFFAFYDVAVVKGGKARWIMLQTAQYDISANDDTNDAHKDMTNYKKQ